MPQGTCNLPGCERKAYCRQMCKPHYEAERGYDQARKKPAVCESCGIGYMRGRTAWTNKCAPCAKRDAGPKIGASRRTNYPKCAVYFPECIQCGTRFAARRAGVGLCSRDCGRQRNHQRYIASTPEPSCSDCGRPRSKFASHCEDCRAKRLEVAKQKARERSRQRGRDYGKTDRQRARRYGVKYEPVARRKVYERDNWQCGICALPVDPTLKHPDPKSASLDHVMPLSRGGSHTYDNTQCAHWDCNVKKGATLLASAA